MSFENNWYYKCLGSPIASITAAVVAEALKSPENYGGNISEERRDRDAGNLNLMTSDLIFTICDCQAMFYNANKGEVFANL